MNHALQSKIDLLSVLSSKGPNLYKAPFSSPRSGALFFFFSCGLQLHKAENAWQKACGLLKKYVLTYWAPVLAADRGALEFPSIAVLHIVSVCSIVYTSKKTRLLQNTYVLFIEQWNYIMLLDDIRYSMYNCTSRHRQVPSLVRRPCKYIVIRK